MSPSIFVTSTYLALIFLIQFPKMLILIDSLRMQKWGYPKVFEK